MKRGGYDSGYKNCICFWGEKPGSLIIRLDSYISNFKGKRVLDLGCGEGKNSIFLANKGCIIDAYDISKYALNNFKTVYKNSPNIRFQRIDVLDLKLNNDKYDIIIAYGLFHCFDSKAEISTLIHNCLNSLKKKGIFVICAFNSRKQELKAHPDFVPILISHSDYLSFFNPHSILFESDEDLYETHPHNNIPHTHSMTRLLIRK